MEEYKMGTTGSSCGSGGIASGPDDMTSYVWIEPQPEVYESPSGSVITQIPGRIEASFSDMDDTAGKLCLLLMNIADELRLNVPKHGNVWPAGISVFDKVHTNNKHSIEIAAKILTMLRSRTGRKEEGT